MADLFVDTGIWLAALDRKDGLHAHARDLLDRERRHRAVVSEFVFAETVTLLRWRLGPEAAALFGRGFLNGNAGEIVACTRADLTAGLALIAQYDDQRLSLADATSFVLVRRLGIQRVASFDSHFRIVLAEREILS